MSTDSDTGSDREETLDEALEIVNEPDAALTDQEKEAEATEEVGTVLGDFA
jgi:hypothetical protein